MTRSAAIHLPDRLKHQWWAPGTFAAGRHLFHLTVADEDVEVEADGVGMHAQRVRDRQDAHRIRRRPQQPQHLPTAPGGFSDRLDLVTLLEVWLENLIIDYVPLGCPVSRALAIG